MRRVKPWGRVGRRLLVGALVATVAVAGVPSVSNAASGPAAKTNANAVLKVAISMSQGGGNTNLDPRLSVTAFDILYLSALYAPLVKYDRIKNKYTPYMAKSVTIVDPQTFRVVLRDGWTFDNGTPVTANDARATLLAMVANQKAGRCNGCNGALALISGVDVVDNQTFVIKTASAASGVIYEILSGRDSFIVPANAGADQNTKPVGNGPFKLVSFTAGQQMVFTKSTSFVEADKVKLGGLQFNHLTAGTPQVNALLAGDVDFAHELGVEGFQAVKSRGFNAFNIGDRNGAFDYIATCHLPGSWASDVRVRQALYIGTDRVALGKAMLQEPTWSIFSRDQAEYDKTLEKKYAYNPTKAKKMLKEAGVAGQTINVLSVSGTLVQWPKETLILKSQWEKLGINVNLVPSSDLTGDWSTPSRTAATTKVIPPKAPASITGFSRPGLQKLTRLFTPGGASNVCGNDTGAIPQIATDLAGLSPTDPKAIAKWKEAQAIIADQALIIPIAVAPVVTGWAKKVSGVTPDTLTIPFFADWASLSVKGTGR